MNVVCPRCGIALGLVEPLDREDTVHRPCPACWPHLTGRPTRFVYVSQSRPKLFRELAEEYRGDLSVLVLFDRRDTQRRQRAERRRTPRPETKERRAPADRRKTQAGIVVRGARKK